MRTIAHISDLHFGRIDPPVVEGLVADLADRKPDLLVISGDLTQRARSQQFEDAMTFLRRLPTPQLVVPGNHDIPLYNLFARFLWPLAAYKRSVTTDLAPIVQTDDLVVLGLNSARSFTQTSGWLSPWQLDEVRRVLGTAHGKFRVLVTHHPFIPPPRKPDADVILHAKQYLSTLHQAGVDLLLAGHLHLAYHDDIRSHYKASERAVLSIQAGTATSTRRRGEPNAYNWISVSPMLCTVAVRAWVGQRFEESLVTRYECRDGGWQRVTQVPVDEVGAEVVGARPA